MMSYGGDTMTPIVRVLAGLVISAGVQAMTQAAQAAPKVAGAYAVLSWHLCQTVVHTPTGSFARQGGGFAPALTSYELDWNASAGGSSAGMMSISISTVTFPSVPTSSGQATMNGVEVGAHSTRNDNPANNPPVPNTQFERHVTQGAMPFTLTDTTLTAGDQVFDIVTSQSQRGIVTSMHILRQPIPNDYCADALTMTKRDINDFGSGQGSNAHDGKDDKDDKDDSRH